MEVIEVSGVIRQVLTHDFLVDVQELPSGQEGFELKWFRCARTRATKTNGLYQLPSSDPVKYVKVSNPTPGNYTMADVYSLMDTPGATERKIHYRYIFETNTTTGRLEHRMETWTDVPTASGTSKIAVGHPRIPLGHSGLQHPGPHPHHQAGRPERGGGLWLPDGGIPGAREIFRHW